MLGETALFRSCIQLRDSFRCPQRDGEITSQDAERERLAAEASLEASITVYAQSLEVHNLVCVRLFYLKGSGNGVGFAVLFLPKWRESFLSLSLTLLLCLNP